MKLSSRVVGLIVLAVLFGGVSLFSALGWWQTQGQGQHNRNHGQESSADSHPLVSRHGVIHNLDSQGLFLSLDDGTLLHVETGNARYNRSIGFAPQLGEPVSVVGYVNEDGLFNAIRVTLESSGQTFVFRSETGQPLWSGKGQGNGASH